VTAGGSRHRCLRSCKAIIIKHGASASVGAPFLTCAHMEKPRRGLTPGFLRFLLEPRKTPIEKTRLRWNASRVSLSRLALIAATSEVTPTRVANLGCRQDSNPRWDPVFPYKPKPRVASEAS
jgi:hypothetical protein